jgi:hypothetical protein
LAVRVEIPLTQIQAVTPTRRYALLVTWVDAGKLKKAEFAVAASRFSPGWNPENATARDSFLAQVSGHLPNPERRNVRFSAIRVGCCTCSRRRSVDRDWSPNVSAGPGVRSRPLLGPVTTSRALAEQFTEFWR